MLKAYIRSFEIDEVLEAVKMLAECISVKPGSHLRHNDITGRSRKRKKYLMLMFYVSSVNNTS